MVMGEAVIVAGIGCRKGVSANKVLAAITAALEQHGLQSSQLLCLATVAAKADERAITEAASTLSLELIIVPDQKLAETSSRQLSHSEISLATTGTKSASEAAALAAAGPGSRLLGPRIAVGPVTCALAVRESVP